MNKLFKSALFSLLLIIAFYGISYADGWLGSGWGRDDTLEQFTVATLPATSAGSRIVAVTDADDVNDCASGGGATYNVCIDSIFGWINF